LKERQTRTSTSLDEKLKGDCFIENGKYFQRKFLTSIRYFYTKKESKIIPTTDQNLIKERVQAINDEFLSGS
jgi:hypothetical protein